MIAIRILVGVARVENRIACAHGITALYLSYLSISTCVYWNGNGNECNTFEIHNIIRWK